MVSLKKFISKYHYYLLLNLLLFVNSFGGIFSKFAGKSDFLSFRFIFFYGIVLTILALYAFFWQRILKKLPLTSAYANKAIAMIWTMLWGAIFFDEIITLKMIIGLIIVIFGVGLVVTDNE